MKNFFENIKKIKELKNGKAILFFGFYLFFFLILILVLRFSDKKPLSKAEEYEKGNGGYNFYFDKIVKNNYSFKFNINLDGVTHQYSGKKYNSYELFNYMGLEYFRNEDNYFVNNNLWLKSENPYLYSEFLDINNIMSIIDVAYNESKTSYEDGKQVFNLLISTNTLNQKLNNLDSDFLEEPNKIIINTDEDKFINNIIFKLDSYCKLNKLCQNSLEINLEYNNFGNVEEIESPI